MGVAQFVDFKPTGRGGMAVRGWEAGGDRVTYDALLREGWPRISDHI